MKKRTMVAFGVAAVLGMGLASVGYAAQAEGLTEAQTTGEAELSQGDDLQNDALETITLTIEGKDPIEIANTAGLAITAASVTPQEEDGTLADIVMKASDGQQYEFVDVPYEALGSPELTVDGAFVFLRYTSLTSGKERSIGQTGELTYDDPAKLYAVDDVYIRSEPDDDAEILGVISRGDAIEVLGETATHYLVKKGEVAGYTVRRCVSEDEQDAIAAVQAQKAALEAQRQAQEAAAAAAAAAQPSGGSSVYEVRRQKFEDCDGSGHGYYEITYSDGSTRIQDF